jgi:hypothetical protein
MTSMSSTLGPTLFKKHAAKHRSAPTAPLLTRIARRLRGVALLTGVAVAATGLAVSTGVLATTTPLDGAAAALSASSPAEKLTEADLAEREQRASRSAEDRRPRADRSKARALSNASGVAVTKSEDLSTADPKALARALMPKYGISSSEFDCLDNIWSQESGWNVHADNPTSSAYGIPQALPGSKMSSAGPNWESNAETQIRWGLGYIKARYGSACSAWSYKQGAGWY